MTEQGGLRRLGEHLLLRGVQDARDSDPKLDAHVWMPYMHCGHLTSL